MEVILKQINRIDLFIYKWYLMTIEIKIIEERKDYLKVKQPDEEEGVYEYISSSDDDIPRKIYKAHDVSMRKTLMNKREAALFLNHVLKLENTKNEIKEQELELSNTQFVTK